MTYLGRFSLSFSLLFAASALCSLVFGQNPIVQTNFTADPASLVHDGRFYIYAGRDQAAETGTWFSMEEWRVYSSTDMFNWTDHGPRLRPLDFEWANADAWASQCIQHNGKFYWYVSTNHKDIKGKAIGVAVGDSPLGPFKDARGTALITNDMTPNQGDFDDIDPSVFVDDDGQGYMFWGNGKCKYVKLNADMISFSDSINYVDVPKFGEAPWLHKHNGVYYLSYSSSLPSTIEYCTSDSPTGPWTYGGRLLEPVENCATSHQAISTFQDRWYFVYHNGALPTGGNHRRSVCVEEFTYNEDGSISLLTSTSEGITSAVSTFNPYQRVEAETIAWAEGVGTQDSDAGVVITDIHEGDFIKVRNVDFGRKGAKRFKASIASTSDQGRIEIRLDALDGLLIGTCEIPETGSLTNWEEATVELNKFKGIHDVYFVFKGASTEGMFDFDYWQFEK